MKWKKKCVNSKHSFERDMRCELRELKKTCEFLSEQFEKAKLERAELAKENKALKAANEKLVNERENLKKQVSEHEQRITASEQYSRNCNLEITGIAVMKNENLPQTLQQIGELLVENIEASDVEVCHRVPVKKANAIPNIIVQFRSAAKGKEGAPLKSRSWSPVHYCGVYKWTLLPAYEATAWHGHCPEEGQELALCLDYIGGKIMTRKDESAPMLHIRNAQDVDRIV